MKYLLLLPLLLLSSLAAHATVFQLTGDDYVITFNMKVMSLKTMGKVLTCDVESIFDGIDNAGEAFTATSYRCRTGNVNTLLKNWRNQPRLGVSLYDTNTGKVKAYDEFSSSDLKVLSDL